MEQRKGTLCYFSGISQLTINLCILGLCILLYKHWNIRKEKWFYFNESSFTRDPPNDTTNNNTIDQCTALSCEQTPHYIVSYTRPETFCYIK